MLVRDALIENPLLVLPDTSLLRFIDLVLESNQTTAAVISETQRLLGIVGVHDVFLKIVPHYVKMDRHLMNVLHEEYFEEKFEKFKHMTVADIMTTQVDSVSPTDAVIKAVAMFVEKRRKSLPVIERGALIGIITRRSVLTCVASCAK